jgi:hypothetical protein
VGPEGPTGPQGPSGLSGYRVVVVPVTVKLLVPPAMQTVVVDCPTGASVLSGFIYRVAGGVRYPFPSNVGWTGWPSARGQWTFVLYNANLNNYIETVEAGAVCAFAN